MDEKTIKIILGILFAALSVFGVVNFLKARAEEKEKIEAQNEIARLSKVIEEKEGMWSRLSQQKDNIIEILDSQNKDLADVINNRDEQILSLTEVVARIKSTRIIVRTENITQTNEQGRLRVNFDQTEDPVRVAGFTLTSPPEAELEVSFVRPLRLTTTVTQSEDGSWKTYVISDWPNLEIENIETTVDPFERSVRSGILDSFVVSGDLQTSFDLDSLVGNVGILYDFGSMAIGPNIGVGVLNEQSSVLFGLSYQWKPFR